MRKNRDRVIEVLIYIDIIVYLSIIIYGAIGFMVLKPTGDINTLFSLTFTILILNMIIIVKLLVIFDIIRILLKLVKDKVRGG